MSIPNTLITDGCPCHNYNKLCSSGSIAAVSGCVRLCIANFKKRDRIPPKVVFSLKKEKAVLGVYLYLAFLSPVSPNNHMSGVK